MKEIEFSETLENIGSDTFRFKRVFISEMTKADCLKFKTGAEKNIIRIKEELVKHNEEHIQKTIKTLCEGIDFETNLKIETLANFDQYIEDTITNFRKNAESKKAELQYFIDNVEKIKIQVEENTRKLAAKEKEDLELQMQDEEKIVEVYKTVAE